ncbi:DUF2892 domain-containing protein [Pseudomonas sp. gcc21]|uniref:YgaP family membrane protein n=1 Tax=Pseudomonas sp. gcc21 TaxID=2726989 RepID=UPI001452471A|nr:DUF2892 domain-containing protein [Pseudomonas sp. gcc21]QJD57825.1 DUF2892 domain-containing protein [Pseudomonas sp. gcc21]
MMNKLYDSNAPQNVQGWERAASVAGGLMLLKRGMRTGGVGSVLELALGGMALLRGVTGQCKMKRQLVERRSGKHESKERYSHMPLDSEVHSPDFQDAGTSMPDTTPMGHETHPKTTPGL